MKCMAESDCAWLCFHTGIVFICRTTDQTGLQITVFLTKIYLSLVYRHKRVDGICCFHLHGRRIALEGHRRDNLKYQGGPSFNDTGLYTNSQDCNAIVSHPQFFADQSRKYNYSGCDRPLPIAPVRG